MLEGARQRLEGQLHREGEASTMKMRILGVLEVRRGDCSISREMSGLANCLQCPGRSQSPHTGHIPVYQPQRFLGVY